VSTPGSGAAHAVSTFGRSLTRSFKPPRESLAFLHVTNMHEHNSLSADLWADVYVSARVFNRRISELLGISASSTNGSISRNQSQLRQTKDRLQSN
jgi:hypothetical protein